MYKRHKEIQKYHTVSKMFLSAFPPLCYVSMLTCGLSPLLEHDVLVPMGSMHSKAQAFSFDGYDNALKFEASGNDMLFYK